MVLWIFVWRQRVLWFVEFCACQGDQSWTRLVVVVCFLMCSGCNSDTPQVGTVSGRITVAGPPVPAGRIVFYPAHGRAAMGTSGGNGRYELTTFKPGDGALVDSHVVTIKATRTSGSSGPQTFTEESQGVPFQRGTTEWVVPPEYTDRSTTPLTAEVKAGRNTINFDLATVKTKS